MYIEQTGKAQLINNYSLAMMTATFINNSMAGKRNPTIETLYPEIFAQEKEEKELIGYKNQWLQLAAKHNRKRAGDVL